MYVFKCVYHLVCAWKHLFLKKIPVLQVPEEPKKVVPEKKFPVIKKPEAPPPKGTCAKINVYIISVLPKISFLVVFYSVLYLLTVVCMLQCCTDL